MSLNINSFVPIDTNNELLKFAVDIQSQANVRKPKIAISLPGGHFETDITQNFTYTHTWSVLPKFGFDTQKKSKLNVESAKQLGQCGPMSAIHKCLYDMRILPALPALCDVNQRLKVDPPTKDQ